MRATHADSAPKASPVREPGSSPPQPAGHGDRRVRDEEHGERAGRTRPVVRERGTTTRRRGTRPGSRSAPPRAGRRRGPGRGGRRAARTGSGGGRRRPSRRHTIGRAHPPHHRDEPRRQVRRARVRSDDRHRHDRRRTATSPMTWPGPHRDGGRRLRARTAAWHAAARWFAARPRCRAPARRRCSSSSHGGAGSAPAPTAWASMGGDGRGAAYGNTGRRR